MTYRGSYLARALHRTRIVLPTPCRSGPTARRKLSRLEACSGIATLFFHTIRPMGLIGHHIANTVAWGHFSPIIVMVSTSTPDPASHLIYFQSTSDTPLALAVILKTYRVLAEAFPGRSQQA